MINELYYSGTLLPIIRNRLRCSLNHLKTFLKDNNYKRPQVSHSWTTDSFKEVMSEINPNILILGEYVSAKTPIKVRCLVDGYEWTPTPDALLSGVGCGVCSNKIILKGVNDLWTTDPKIARMLANPEEGYRYCRNSQKKLKFKCPNCGSIKEIAPYVIYTYGLGCRMCSDGISYPEKVIRSILLQSNVRFNPEYSPEWIKPRRYDFYLPDYNTIIETNGRQHYDNAFDIDGAETVEEIQANDKEKYDLAIKNGIDDVIFVNCYFSEIEYIKQSIISDKRLQSIINFDLINWHEVDLQSQKSILIEVCEKWDKSDEYEADRVKSFASYYKLSKTTIRCYLKKGTELGLCNYNGNNYIKQRKGGPPKKKVYELDLNYNIVNIYESYTEVKKIIPSTSLYNALVGKNNTHIYKNNYWYYESEYNLLNELKGDTN